MYEKPFGYRVNIKERKYRKVFKEKAMSNADMGSSEVLPDPTIEPGQSVGDTSFKSQH